MEDIPNPRMYLPAVFMSILLFVGVFWSYQSARNRQGKILLPGGVTYVGPTPTGQTTVNSSLLTEGKISVAPETKWVEKKGSVYPYSFAYPESLSLGVFPNDPYDAVTIFYPGTDANTNIFFRVEDLTKLNKTEYIGKPLEYVRIWWKDYAWKGVSDVTVFTNTKGLKGYRAKYVDDKGQTPYDHVFFEIPGRTDIIIWMNGKLFTPEVFDKLVDSVSWEK